MFTSDLSKIVGIEFKPVFSNCHYMPCHFRQLLQKLAFATQKNYFRISLAHIPLCNNIVTQVSNYFSESKKRKQNTGLFGCTILQASGNVYFLKTN